MRHDTGDMKRETGDIRQTGDRRKETGTVHQVIHILCEKFFEIRLSELIF